MYKKSMGFAWNYVLLLELRFDVFLFLKKTCKGYTDEILFKERSINLNEFPKKLLMTLFYLFQRRR